MVLRHAQPLWRIIGGAFLLLAVCITESVYVLAFAAATLVFACHSSRALSCALASLFARPLILSDPMGRAGIEPATLGSRADPAGLA